MPKANNTRKKSRAIDTSVIDSVASGSGTIPLSFPDERRSYKENNSSLGAEMENGTPTHRSSTTHNLPTLTRSNPYAKAASRHRASIKNMSGTLRSFESYISPVHSKNRTKTQKTTPQNPRSSLFLDMNAREEYHNANNNVTQYMSTTSNPNTKKRNEQYTIRRNSNYDKNRHNLFSKENENFDITQTNNRFSILDNLNKQDNNVTENLQTTNNTDHNNINLSTTSPAKSPLYNRNHKNTTKGLSPKDKAIEQLIITWHENKNGIEDKIHKTFLDYIEKSEEAEQAKDKYLAALKTSEEEINTNTETIYQKIVEVSEMEDEMSNEEIELWEKLNAKMLKTQQQQNANKLIQEAQTSDKESKKRKMENVNKEENDYIDLVNELDIDMDDNVYDLNPKPTSTQPTEQKDTQQHTEYIHQYEAVHDIAEEFIDSIKNWSSIKDAYAVTDFELIIDPTNKKKITLRTSKEEVHNTVNTDLNNVLGTNLKHISVTTKTGKVKWLKLVLHKNQRELNDNELAYLKQELKSTFIKRDGTTTRDNLKYKATTMDNDIYNNLIEKGFTQVGSKKIWCHPREVPKRRRLACLKCHEYTHRADKCPSRTSFCKTCAGKHDDKEECKTIEIRCITCMRRKLDYHHPAQSAQCPVYREFNNMPPLPTKVTVTTSQHQIIQQTPAITSQSYSSALTQKQANTNQENYQNTPRDMIRNFMVIQDNKTKEMIQNMRKYEERSLNRVAGAYSLFDDDKNERILKTITYLNDKDLKDRIDLIKTNTI
jgi:hypothetical protein